jgi:TRAP-type mannitol/chloroaromatic compound transport system permease small subunit
LHILRKYVQIVDAISEGLGWISMILVVATIVIGFFNVLARYVGRFIGLQLSSNLFIELQWYLFSLIFFFGFAYILKHNINVRVDFIYAKWPKKRKATLDFWGHLFFLIPFCILAIWVSISPVMRSWGQLPDGSWGTWEISPDPSGLPRAPIKSMIVLAFTMLLAQTLSELIKLWPVMRGQGEFVPLEEIEAPLRIE